MANRGRFIFDTNVIVSALLMKKSVAREALDKARTAGEILLSIDVIEELHDVLSRPAFDRYIDEEDRLKFLSLLVKEATLVDITDSPYATGVMTPKGSNDYRFSSMAHSNPQGCYKLHYFRVRST